MSKCVDGKYCVIIIIRCALWIVKESLDFCLWRCRTIIAWMMFGCIKMDLFGFETFFISKQCYFQPLRWLETVCPVICPVFLQTILPRLPPCPFSPITASLHLPQLWSLSSQQCWEHLLCSAPPTCCMLWQRRVLAASVEDVRMPPLRRSLLLLSVSHTHTIVPVSEKKRMISRKKR